MGRRPDVERRQELLDAVVAYLAEHGLADVSLRPMARRSASASTPSSTTSAPRTSSW